MKSMISVTLLGMGVPAEYKVHFENGAPMGDFLMSPDGYYDWWPESDRDGSLPSYVLRMLADELDKLNADWDKQVQAAHFGEPNGEE
jgi:hypothetical protein